MGAATPAAENRCSGGGRGAVPAGCRDAPAWRTERVMKLLANDGVVRISVESASTLPFLDTPRGACYKKRGFWSVYRVICHGQPCLARVRFSGEACARNVAFVVPSDRGG